MLQNKCSLILSQFITILCSLIFFIQPKLVANKKKCFSFLLETVTFFDLSQNFSTVRYQKKCQQSEWQQIQTNVYAECD